MSAAKDGRPYLVFTHDWAQVADGTIELALVEWTDNPAVRGAERIKEGGAST